MLVTLSPSFCPPLFFSLSVINLRLRPLTVVIVGGVEIWAYNFESALQFNKLNSTKLTEWSNVADKLITLRYLSYHLFNSAIQKYPCYGFLRAF